MADALDLVTGTSVPGTDVAAHIRSMASVQDKLTTTGGRWARLWNTLVRHRWRLLTLFVAVLVPLTLFGVLAEDVIDREGFFFDDPILLYARGLSTPGVDIFMLTMSWLGYKWGVVPLAAIVLLWLLLRRHKRDGLFFGLSVIGAALLNQGAKLFFGRERPRLWTSIAPEYNFSFPSGHAMGSMALVAALVVLLWPTRWRYPILLGGGLFVLLVSLSRVYLGVHYPSDILAGWVASFAWVMGLSSILYGRLGKPTPAGDR